MAHAEVDPDADTQLITLLDCSLLGEEAAVVVEPGTRAAEAMGAGPVTKHYFCRFGLNVDYLQVLLITAWFSVGRTNTATPALLSCPGTPSSSVRCSNRSCPQERRGLTPLLSPLRLP